MKYPLINNLNQFESLLSFGKSIVEECRNNSIDIRLIGSVGIYYHLKSKGVKLDDIRYIKDIDFILLSKNDIFKLIDIFDKYSYSYSKDTMINTEGKRIVFYKKDNNSSTVDVIVNPFYFAEKIDFANRFQCDLYALSITDLFLTKMQRKELNKNDTIDLITLLNAFEISEDETGLNINRINAVLSNDWGFYSVFLDNLSFLLMHNDFFKDKFNLIESKIVDSDKTLRWRIRSLFGKLFRTYNKVENIN